ncbi:hypothetical protein CPAR01_02367 [Colletotrichum paranaense]|uniref:Uncharacterized protein n=1 Tax=Colletotrichum paranaense TaxID=1914294 RepID=A0ABQ9SZW1_9PEZI|nr:uncharacterized protein CPAR01_02367 [Colletotrichum paranaense]KAK1544865.1 hypothetical protein CPAR01_02367 [Colletotrichum paranaense]
MGSKQLDKPKDHLHSQVRYKHGEKKKKESNGIAPRTLGRFNKKLVSLVAQGCRSRDKKVHGRIPSLWIR